MSRLVCHKGAVWLAFSQSAKKEFVLISRLQTDALRKKTTEIIQHAMASVALVFRLVVCWAVLNHGPDFKATAAAFPAQENCTVSTVTEGDPAVMTFKLRSGIDTASKKFYAHLRRNDRKLTDIITCDGLKVACDVKDGHPMFQVDDNIKENILTVRISNMSRELEDTYLLQLYFNGTTEPTSSCTLNITYTHTTAHAEAQDENGSNAWIAAPIGLLFLLLLIGGLLFVRQKKPACWQECTGMFTLNRNQPKTHDQDQQTPMILSCTPDVCSPLPGAHTNADVQSPRLTKEETNKNRSATTKQNIPGVGRISAASDPIETGNDINTEQLSRSEETSPEKMRLTKEETNQNRSATTKQNVPRSATTKQNIPGVGRISAASDPIEDRADREERSIPTNENSLTETGITDKQTCTNKGSTMKQNNPRVEGTPAASDSNTDRADGEERSITTPENPLALTGTGYFFENVQKEDEEKLLKSQKNGPGSFLIRPNKRGGYVLAVNFDGQIHRFDIYKHAHGYTFVCYQHFFPTLDELVDHHTSKAIQDVERVYGTLIKPCVQTL